MSSSATRIILPAEYASLDTLLKAEFVPAFNHALGCLSDSGLALPDRTLAITGVLLPRAAVRAWPTLWAAMSSDDDLARELLLQVAAFQPRSTFLCRHRRARDSGPLCTYGTAFPAKRRCRMYDGFRRTPAGSRVSARRYPSSSRWPGYSGLRRGTERGNREPSRVQRPCVRISLAEQVMRIATWEPLTSKEVLAPTDKPDLQLVDIT